MSNENNPKNQMIEVPSGSFVMGSDSGLEIEAPAHEVHVDAFLIDQYPVTNNQFKQFVKDCPAWQKEEGLQECYNENNDFSCDFVANGYRLPTEAEFEKAARGGQSSILYPWGDEIDKSKANFDNIIGDTTEVGSYEPNGYGLYDMGGNIGHWCQDWFDSGGYGTDLKENPRGLEEGTHRVYKGGSWGNPEEYQRITCRFWMLPVNCNPDFGFRCVRKA